MDYYRKECTKCKYVDFIGPASMQQHNFQYHTTAELRRHKNFCCVCAIVFKCRVDYDKHMEDHPDDGDTDPEVFNVDNYREVCPTTYEPPEVEGMAPEEVTWTHVRIFKTALEKMERNLVNLRLADFLEKRKLNLPEENPLADSKFNAVRAAISNSTDRARNQNSLNVPLKIENGVASAPVKPERGNGIVPVFERSENGVGPASTSQTGNVKLVKVEDVQSIQIEGGAKKRRVDIPSTVVKSKKAVKTESTEGEPRRISRRNSNTIMSFCPECPYSSKDQGNFKRHLKTHVKNLKKEPEIKAEWKVDPTGGRMDLRFSNPTVYQCGGCEYATKEQGNFKRHVSTHDKKNDPDATQKERQRKEKEKIKCQFSNCTFETRETGNFSRHMSTHGIPERNKVVNKCHLCNFEIQGYNNMNFHTLREHFMNAPHRCEFCGEIYPTSVTLKNHRYQHAIGIGARS